MIPGPRPSQGHDCPSAGGDGGPHVAPTRVTLTRTGRGWTVVTPTGTATAGDLVEGLSLADLVAEEFGPLLEPDRTTRRSARGPGPNGEPADDSPEGRIAALQRTVAQLEHALAARVSTERAIGVLAERNRTSARAAFESLRREARSSGRPVAELAREVLAGLAPPEPTGAPHAVAPQAVAPHAVAPHAVVPPAAPGGRGTPRASRSGTRQPATAAAFPSPAAAADGRS